MLCKNWNQLQSFIGVIEQLCQLPIHEGLQLNVQVDGFYTAKKVKLSINTLMHNVPKWSDTL